MKIDKKDKVVKEQDGGKDKRGVDEKEIMNQTQEEEQDIKKIINGEEEKSINKNNEQEKECVGVKIETGFILRSPY